MSPHDAPTAQQLIEAVREWMEGDLLNAVSGRLQFHARVAINVLAMVERELEVGDEQHRRHVQRLAELGVADDQELAAAIRSGRMDDRLELVKESVWASVRDKVAVANPKYLHDA